MSSPSRAAFDLDGKVAIVTGASRGVGAATARALAEAGCTVACAARSTRAHPQRTPGTIEDVVEAIRQRGGTALAIPTDLSDPEQVASMVEHTAAEFGRLDILINNAAVTFVGDLDIALKRHDLVMAINLQAPLLATRAAVPHMRAAGGGRIINVSSLAALLPVPGLMSYGISKIALERMTVDCARQLADDRIAVNCFRIDIAVASEGFIANAPSADHSGWEPSSVAAEGIVWMLQQPDSYSGRRESMLGLRRREQIMVSRVASPSTSAVITEMFDGLAADSDSVFEDPHGGGGS
jgi:NAD(P)-dependent dehydrogenase (short-subunit alcohol dehydrogenase family)